MKRKLMNFLVAVMCAIPLGMLFGWVLPLNITYEETRHSSLVFMAILFPVLAAILLLIVLTPFNFIIRKIKLKPYWATAVPAALASLLTITMAIDSAGTPHELAPGFNLESIQRQADAPTIIFISIACMLSCILSPYYYSRNFWPELPGFRQFSKKITLPVIAGWLLAANYPVVSDTTTLAMAEAGHSAAQMKLANIYNQRGIDPAHTSLIKIFISPDPVEEEKRKNKNALKWLVKAAEQGNTEAQEALLDSLGRHFDPDDQKSLAWTENITNPDLQIKLSNIYDYDYDNVVPQDEKKAFEWLMKAAAQSHAGAQRLVSFKYYNGNGVDKDYKKSFEWMEKAAKGGDSEAQFFLFEKYASGEGTTKDTLKAFEWLQKAATQDFREAQLKLGNMYLSGSSTFKLKQDKKKGFELIKKAAEKPLAIPHEQYLLGLLYLHGTGTNKNINEATAWLHKAAADGHSLAKKELEKIDNQ